MIVARFLWKFWPYVVLALLILAAVIFWNDLSARFPWSAESRARRAEEAAAHATLDASARSLEVEGMTAQAARVDTYSHVVITTQAAAAEATAEARSAPDANELLDPARAARLRGIIGGLCDASPRTCAPAPAGNPGGGAGPVSSDGPAGNRDAG